MPAPAELSVPAKAFVAGEYSVLERGEPALVLAVDLRLRATLRELSGRAVELLRRPGGESLRGELVSAGLQWQSGIPAELRFAARAVEVALRLCAEERRDARGFEVAFQDDLSRDGRKLGLGGSAAASVLAPLKRYATDDYQIAVNNGRHCATAVSREQAEILAQRALPQNLAVASQTEQRSANSERIHISGRRIANR